MYTSSEKINETVAYFNDLLDTLLSKAGKRGVLEPFRLARKMGIVVTKSTRIEGSNAQVALVNGRWKITVNSFDPLEVQQFLVAHEMLEIFLPESPEKEELCKMGASFLLIPRGEFEGACCKYEGDLDRLKEDFPFLSFQAMACRSLALQPGIITLLDDGRLTARIASKGVICPPGLTPLEQEVLDAMVELGRPQSRTGLDMVVRGWPVCEKGCHQVILRAEAPQPP